MNTNVEGYSYTDIGGREENEDTWSMETYSNSIVAVLADGLGGEGGGKIASSIACDVISKCGANQSDIDEDTIRKAFVEANEKICESQTDTLHMKSTATYLHISNDRAIWGNIGDTRLYYFFNGELKNFTIDHSLAQLAVFMGEIERKDINTYPRRSKLFRALGSDTVNDSNVDINSVIMKKGVNAFLICSDGLWEYLDDQEITQALITTASAEEWINKLRQLRDQRADENADNNTAAAIIIDVV